MELLKLLAATIIPGIATFAAMLFLPGPHIVRLAVGGAVYGSLLSAILLIAGLVRIADFAEIARMLVKRTSRHPSLPKSEL